MSHESDSAEIFFRNPCAGIGDTRPSERDPVDRFFEEVELERAGGPTAGPLHASRLRSDRDEEPIVGRRRAVEDANELLSKRADARRKLQIALFMKRAQAEGQTIQELIAHAAKHSLETATLMREIVDSGLLERIEADAA
jgi:hypothetical protein